MIITGKHLDRRTFLAGCRRGDCAAVPGCHASCYGECRDDGLREAPVRLAFTYVPNGVTMSNWKPAATGADFEFSRILKPLEPFRSDLFVLSGLDHHNADGAGRWRRRPCPCRCMLPDRVHAKKTAGADIQAA